MAGWLLGEHPAISHLEVMPITKPGARSAFVVETGAQNGSVRSRAEFITIPSPGICTRTDPNHVRANSARRFWQSNLAILIICMALD